MLSAYTTLSIESTCDDTSVAIVTKQNGHVHVHCMLTYTQRIHSQYGGIVPEYASRNHAEWLPKLIQAFQISESSEDVWVSLPNEQDLEEGIKCYQADEQANRSYGRWE